MFILTFFIALIFGIFYFSSQYKPKEKIPTNKSLSEEEESNLNLAYSIYQKEITHISGNQYVDYYWEEYLLNLFKPFTNKTIPNEFKNKYTQLISWRKNLANLREDNNSKYISSYFLKNKNFFKNIEGNPLDNQQIEAIIKNEVCNLVIAGAGSGKTTTIIGKIKYLIEDVGASPDDILTICFNNSAAKELKERIENQGFNIKSVTFHKLGNDIIREYDPSVKIFNEENLDKVLEETINSQIKKDNNIINFFSYYLNSSERDEFNVTDLEEYQKEINNTALITLKGEYVRSYEEVLIANFLFKNKIEYEYEKEYFIPKSMESRIFENFFRQSSIYYRPDFYLPEYDIYIEHFALDKDHKTPNFWNSSDPNAGKKYIDGINWKRNLHKTLNTKLLETYSYYRQEGILEEKLKEMLSKNNVKLTPLKNSEILENIKKTKSAIMYTRFINLLKNFVNYIKQNNISENEMIDNLHKFKSNYSKKRAILFIDIILHVLKDYQDYLTSNREVDFSDMIMKGRELLHKGTIKRNYKYIIIDEFQDISKTRFDLIKEIIDRNKGKLFCVGDDWQSIYGFAGSDLNLFLNVNDKMPFGIKSYIEQTYRYPQSIANLASSFIMKNNKQLKKNIKSFINDLNQENTAYEALYYDKNSGDFTSRNKMIGSVLQEQLLKLPKDSTVLLLTRYNFEKSNFLGDGLVEVKDYKDINVLFYKRKDLKISFKTVHKSKGLQADYVFILNNRDELRGFPSKIEDDDLYKLIKEYDKNDYEYSEERRLFYVAMTRVKKKLFFIISSDNQSIFINEIENNFKNNITNNLCPNCKNNEFMIINQKIFCKKCKEEIDYKRVKIKDVCPRCGKKLVYHKKNKLFIKCSGFPKCDYIKFLN